MLSNKDTMEVNEGENSRLDKGKSLWVACQESAYVGEDIDNDFIIDEIVLGFILRIARAKRFNYSKYLYDAMHY